MTHNVLVLDANILIRAVLGKKVRELLFKHNATVNFFTPDVCVEDAQKYLPRLFEKRAMPYEPALEALSHLKSIIQVVDESIYQAYQIEAKKRLNNRDLLDWSIVATAFALNSAIWTEDQDFFGTGWPIWTTDRIHIFFESL